MKLTPSLKEHAKNVSKLSKLDECPITQKNILLMLLNLQCAPMKVVLRNWISRDVNESLETWLNVYNYADILVEGAFLAIECRLAQMNVFSHYCLTFSANNCVFSLNEEQKVSGIEYRLREVHLMLKYNNFVPFQVVLNWLEKTQFSHFRCIHGSMINQMYPWMNEHFQCTVWVLWSRKKPSS